VVLLCRFYVYAYFRVTQMCRSLFNNTLPTERYSLSLHDALPIYLAKPFSMMELVARVRALLRRSEALARNARLDAGTLVLGRHRSEEHTSELQSREKLVCRLLLEKKTDNE